MTIMDTHHYAMELVDKANLAKQSGEIEKANNCLLEAFYAESQAAMKYKNKKNLEPTRSVLFRSAASLGIECGKLEESKKMITLGLSGFPPQEIAEELNELLEQVYLIQHKQVVIQGNLLFADATKKKYGVIELVDSLNTIHKINVPLSMMADIVRPLFDYEVIVKGKRDNRGQVLLEDISKINEI